MGQINGDNMSSEIKEKLDQLLKSFDNFSKDSQEQMEKIKAEKAKA